MTEDREVGFVRRVARWRETWERTRGIQLPTEIRLRLALEGLLLMSEAEEFERGAMPKDLADEFARLGDQVEKLAGKCGRARSAEERTRYMLEAETLLREMGELLEDWRRPPAG